MASIRLHQASRDYVKYMKAQGLRPATVAGHSLTLDHCLNAWGDIDLRDITPADVDTMFSQHHDWATGTRNLNLTNLRQFLKWCRHQGHMPPDYDPTAGWRTLRVERRAKTWLPLNEINELLDAARCPRDRALMAVGVYTFMRASEIVSVKWKDVDFEANEIDIYRIKTRQADRLPLCAELRSELLDRWLPLYEAQHGPVKPEWLVVPALGPWPMTGVPGQRSFRRSGAPQPIHPLRKVTNPHNIVKRAMREIGYDRPGNGLHVLRRSGARNLFESLAAQGHDGAARMAQSVLGHGSITMTEVYLGIDSQRRVRNKILAGNQMFPSSNPTITQGE